MNGQWTEIIHHPFTLPACSIRQSEDIWGLYLWSYYLTLGPQSEREECWLTVWSGSCFTLGWAASSVFFFFSYTSGYSLGWHERFGGCVHALELECVLLVGLERLRRVGASDLEMLCAASKGFYPPGQSKAPLPHRRIVSSHPGASLEVVVTAWRAAAKSRVCSPSLLRRALKSTWPT